VFYSDDYESELSEEVKEILETIIEDESLPRSAIKRTNPFLFKTPLDIVFTKAEPERRFLETLCKKENAEKIGSYIKSRDVGFYPIEYSVTTTGGKHSKQLSFNPDFFIKYIDNGITYIIVVEIKYDNDDSDENRAKFKYASQHFKDLNSELLKQKIKQKYIFHFLSPNNYTEFFQYLRDGRLVKGQFSSELESKLMSEDDEE
jgi:type III restriction enzyme